MEPSLKPTLAKKIINSDKKPNDGQPKKLPSLAGVKKTLKTESGILKKVPKLDSAAVPKKNVNIDSAAVKKTPTNATEEDNPVKKAPEVGPAAKKDLFGVTKKKSLDGAAKRIKKPKLEPKSDPDVNKTPKKTPRKRSIAQITETSPTVKSKRILNAAESGLSPSRKSSTEDPLDTSAPIEDMVIKPPPIKRTKLDAAGMNNTMCDPFCWVCHKEGTNLDCQVCPRAYHSKCNDMQQKSTANLNFATDDWICPECKTVMAAEDVDTQSPAMSMLTLEQLCALLKFSLGRIKKQSPEEFHRPVSVEDYPKYLDYVINPLDISLLEKNIKHKSYGSTEGFLSDVKWLFHNSVIFNGSSHKLTTVAKGLVKMCRDEMKEIETCPDCYLHAHILKENWFVEPCRKPHVLVWAKLKGFPYWPGKVVKIDNGNADVRFFGAHDKAWVPINLCFLLSQEMPQNLKIKKKASFDSSIEELAMHIQKLRSKLGGFEYARSRTPLDPERTFLLPISKVTTGRRHSDAEQVAAPRGRTFTLVTSSWTRKQQAEGALPKPKDRPKETKEQTPPPPEVNESSKIVEQDEEVDTNKNPPPTGVFEISNNSLELPKLNLKSTSIVLKKVPESPYKDAIERISERILGDTEMPDNVSDEEEPDTSKAYEDNAEDEPDPHELKIDENSDSSKPSAIQPVSFQNNKSIEEVPIIPEFETEEPEETSNTSSPVKLTLKRSSLFARKLEETIMNCKAKLGIDEEIAEMGTEASESESENTANELSETEKSNSVKTKNKTPEMSIGTPEISNTTGQDSADSNKSREPKESTPSGSGTVENGVSKSANSKMMPELATPDSPHITQYAHKLIDFVQELCKDTDSPSNPQATIRSLELEIEKLKWQHKQEMMEVKHNTDLVLLEVRASMDVVKQKRLNEVTTSFLKELTKQKYRMEREKNDAVEEARKSITCVSCKDKSKGRNDNSELKEEFLKELVEQKLQAEREKQEAIDQTKKKQWCSNCSNESIFYCCWNTSYCDQACQKIHWPVHMSECSQNQSSVSSTSGNIPPLQKPQPVNKPKANTALQFTLPQGFQLINNKGAAVSLLTQVATPGGPQLRLHGPVSTNIVQNTLIRPNTMTYARSIVNSVQVQPPRPSPHLK